MFDAIVRSALTQECKAEQENWKAPTTTSIDLMHFVHEKLINLIK